MPRVYPPSRSPVSAPPRRRAVVPLLLGLTVSAAAACGPSPVVLDFPPAQQALLSVFDRACAQARRTKNDVRAEYIVQTALAEAQPLLANGRGWVARLGSIARLGDQRAAVDLAMGRAHLVDTLSAERPLLARVARLEVGDPVRLDVFGAAVSPALLRAMPGYDDARAARPRSTSPSPGIRPPTVALRRPAVRDVVCRQQFVGQLRAIRQDRAAAMIPAAP